MKTPISPDFTIRDRVRSWAQLKGYTRLEEHLDYFILTCEAHGYKYSNWDSAFMCAVRDDWAKLRQGNNGRAASHKIVEFPQFVRGVPMPEHLRRKV